MDNHHKILYTKETLNYLLNKNNDFPYYSQRYLETTQQGKISPNQRQNLISWISETCESQATSKKTCQIAIYCVDYFLCQKYVNNFSLLELIGLICISISLKYEESRELSPQKIFSMCQRRFTLEAIMATEVYILNALGWKIDMVTPIELLEYIFELTCEDVEHSKITSRAQDFIQIALADYSISRHSPAIIAVSSAICVLQISNYQDFCKDWLKVLETQTNICIATCATVAEMLKEKVMSLSSC